MPQPTSTQQYARTSERSSQTQGDVNAYCTPNGDGGVRLNLGFQTPQGQMGISGNFSSEQAINIARSLVRGVSDTPAGRTAVRDFQSWVGKLKPESDDE